MKTIEKLIVVFFILSFPMIVFSAPKDRSPQDEITDCTIISEAGVYRITRNLPGNGGLLPSGDCISIEIDSVVINLTDHTITGPATGLGAAITDKGIPRTNISIRNGTVTGFELGINLAASSDSKVENIHSASNSSDGISIGEKSVLRNNTAILNSRGFVLNCPTNATGNSAWDNTSNDYIEIDPELCTVDAGHNSFGSTGTIGCPTCSQGLTDCLLGTCSDLLIDENNCGSCGSSCNPGEICNTGTCTLNCQTGLNNCGGVCRDLSSDRNHCGDCGTLCGAGEICVGGVCTSI